MTENHDFNEPQKGTTDWHIPLNENFSRLDRVVEIRDGDSNRTQYQPKRGAKFFATDTENEYIGDGNRWVKVQTSGSSPAFDAVQRTSSLEARRSQLSISEIGNTFTDLGQIIGDNYNYPTAIHAGRVFDNPLGEWYVFSSPYQSNSVDLFYADNIEGPYQKHGPVLSAPSDSDHADAPHVLYVPERDEVQLHYHQGLGSQGNAWQYQMLATASPSSDGTNWTKQGGPSSTLDGRPRTHDRWDEGERTYLTIQRSGMKYWGTYNGRDSTGNERGIGVCWSKDGRKWETLDHPVGWGNVIPDYDPRQSEAFLAPSLLNLAGELVITYSDRNSSGTYAFTLNQAQDDVTAEDRTKFLDTELIAGDSITVGDRTYIFHKNRLGYLDWSEYL